jgi:uncharacterized protein
MDEAGQAGVTAISQDARTFSFGQGGAMPLSPGDLVVLRPTEGEPMLGQVLDRVAGTGAARVDGSGVLMGALTEEGALRAGARRPFAVASVEPATARHLEALQRSRDAELPIGMWSSCGVDVPARLRAQGFGRHTFLCGQSGSGKTFALGVILEQLLLGTDLRMVVLDPNADFVRLGEPRPDAPADTAARISEFDIRVLGADSTSAEPLRLRFATMPRQAQAALLRLDPLADRGEYNQFLHMMDDVGPQEVGAVVRDLQERGPDGQSLAQRLENLGMMNWEVWAGPLASAGEVVEAGARLTVLDLSGFRSPQEPLAVSLDLVEMLWAQRERRTPTLIVIDEAHNLCPVEPASPMQAALVERLVQIAAEGRKYGLWLLLSTQRPSKIHPQILSQCDNLMLMRMNSPGDIAELAEVFGFAPPEMLRSSKFFVQGEALVAGGFVPVPSIVRMGARHTFEGGSDVRVPVQRREGVQPPEVQGSAI